uniref:MEKHLA domain-containing protein n=1 Tax=Aegilops tauschii subsp. strangulata TaxID=200361 RepID=A0A453JCM3_AEGTS
MPPTCTADSASVQALNMQCLCFAVYLQGHVYLPSGVCMSGMGRHVSFDQAVAWKVLGEDSSVHCLALCFVNWSFV